jgi:hypothetical protein
MSGAVLLKYLLTRMGAFVSPRVIYNLTASINYLEVGRWMQAADFRVGRFVTHRTEVFDLIGARIADKRVLYVECGVFTGAATRYWSNLLRNPESCLHGFDTFEGLPEDWIARRPKGHFSTQGRVPVIEDTRVHFFKGRFEETLVGYTPPEHDVLFLLLDADLYSSTQCALTALEPFIVPGTYVYFDEFNHRNDELRAFDEFIRRTGMVFGPVVATYSLEHIVFQRVR